MKITTGSSYCRTTTEDVEAALTQLRSLGVPTLYANQTMDQIGELSDKILINAENRIIMRTQQPDAGMYAKHYEAAGFSGADVSNQEPTEHQYARFVVDGKTAGPLSMVPLPWPAPSEVLVEAYSGPDWQTITPATLPRRPGDDRTLADTMADRISSNYDAALCHLIYQEPYSEQRAMDLAKMPDEEWNLMRSRWAAIAVAQRQYIDDNPGCIPDRKERIRWRSRLRSRRPRLLATIEFLRIRRATGLDELVKQVQDKKDKKDQRKDGRSGAATSAAANGSFGGRDEGQQTWRNATEPAKPPFEGPAERPGAAPLSEG